MERDVRKTEHERQERVWYEDSINTKQLVGDVTFTYILLPSVYSQWAVNLRAAGAQVSSSHYAHKKLLELPTENYYLSKGSCVFDSVCLLMCMSLRL